MNSSVYWNGRQNQNIKHAKSIENNFLAEQQKQYAKALKNIEGKVSNLYAKYGSKGILSRSDLYDFNRYNNLRNEIYKKCSALGKQQQSEMYSALANVYKDTFRNIDFEDSSSVIKWNKMNETAMKNSVNSIRYGKDFSNRIWDNTDLLAKKVSSQIESMVNGSGTISEMKKALQKEFNSNFANVDRLVRTESMYNLNNATLDRYKDIGITEYKIVVTEDSRTSEICNEMNGKVFKISEAEVGVNLPPLHIRCRSTIIPVMDDDLTKENNKNKILVDNIDKQNINTYISSESYKINNSLRENINLSDSQQKFCNSFDKTLDKFPDYKGTVYRSITSKYINNLESFKQRYQTGNLITEKSYISSSLDIYDETMDIQFVIKSKTGKNISNINKSEKEIIFKRNTQFFITSTKDNIIFMEEII